MTDHLKKVINVTVEMSEVPSLPDFEYKARRWTDERQAGLATVGRQLSGKRGGMKP
jgi:hypothetical protein